MDECCWTRVPGGFARPYAAEKRRMMVHFKNPCHSSCRGSKYGVGGGGWGGTQEEITSDWSRHASTVRTARCVPWRQGLTKENKVQLKKKESERRRKKHWLIWERLKKDPGVQREAATRRRHKFFSKMDVNWRLDVLLRGQDTNVHLSIFLNHSFNLFLSIYSPRPTQKFLSHTRMIYWWYNDLTPDFEHSDPDLK